MWNSAVKRKISIMIDDRLMDEVMRLTGSATECEAVDLALRYLVRKNKRRDITALVGKVKFRDGFDPKDGFG